MKSAIQRLVLLLACPLAASAATINVTTTIDEYGSNAAACSLREALRAAEINLAFGGCSAGSGNDAINLSNGRYVLSRTGTDENVGSVGDLDVNAGTVILQGALASKVIIDAGLLTDRVLHVSGTSSVSLHALTITGGVVVEPFANDTSGGGVRVEANAVLNLLNAVVVDNKANVGGGIYNLGTFSATRSTLASNTAVNTGGGLFHAGDFAQLTNVTVSGNVADVAGGILARSPLTMNNGTIARNLASGGYGAGLRTDGNAAQSLAIKLSNSLFADNKGGLVADDLYCTSPVTTGGSNLVENTNGSGCVLVKDEVETPRDLLGDDPHLAPLFDIGNGVPVHALMPDSVAIAAANASGTNACDARDARYRSRPLPNSCDMGAYESVVDFEVQINTDAVDANPGNGICGTIFPAVGDEVVCSLRAAVQEANLATGSQTIRLGAGIHHLSIGGPGQNAAQGDLDVTEGELVIIGDGPGSSIIEGDGGLGERLLDLSGPARSAALLGVRLRQGASAEEGGAMRLLTGNLLMFEAQIDHSQGQYGGGLYAATPMGESHRVHIERSAIARNKALVQGGGVFITNASLFLLNSSVGENQAVENGGGIKLQAGVAELNFSSISDNRVSGGFEIAARGGGIHLTQSALGILRGSLIANNEVLGFDPDAADCSAPGFNENGFGGISLLGYNWLGDSSGCAIEGEGTNFLDLDPQLSQMHDLQSATLLPAPQPGSPLLDAIPESLCLDLSGVPVQQDQAGNARPPGTTANCDIGAFEGVSDLIFRDGFE